METNEPIPPDSSKIHSIVYQDGIGFLAMGNDGDILFEIFPYDNGPDYPSEGLFRIIQDGMIGYADEKGNVVIKPQFSAARPFQNGMAAFCNGCIEVAQDEHKVWKGGKWGFINRKGEVVIPAKYDQVIENFDKGAARVVCSDSVILINKLGVRVKSEKMKYLEWTELLGSATQLMAKMVFGDKLNVELSWSSNDRYVFSRDSRREYLRIVIKNVYGKELMEYDLIPWQNFTVKSPNNLIVAPIDLIAVTDYAIVHGINKPGDRDEDDDEVMNRFHQQFLYLVEADICQQPQENGQGGPDLPDNVQFISKKLYLHYADLQIAIPGSTIQEDTLWAATFKGKMVHLQSVPDMGKITTRWIKGNDPPPDSYYSSAEDDLLSYFEEALYRAENSPSRRNDIFQETITTMRKLFSSANSRVNFLFNKYEERLGRWLLIEEDIPVNLKEDNIIGDYQPKLTKDSALDYMPVLSEDFKTLPEARLENIISLLELLRHYQDNATSNPGRWEDGNILLGAQPREYRPSRDELLASETGERLASIVHNYPQKDIDNLLNQNGIEPMDMEYTRFTFTHVDVMGSGRFFYVDKMEKITIQLK
jgi:hypothetical protein